MTRSAKKCRFPSEMNNISDLYLTAIFLTISLIIFLTVFVFARFSYEISQDYLRMRQQIFIYIPFSFCKIKTKNIREVRRCDFKKDLLKGGYIFGNLFRKKGVMIILRRWSFRGKRIFISPENPERFIEQMNSIIRLNSHMNSTGASTYSARS